MHSNPVTLAISMGDPAGIGPEVIRRYVNRHGPDPDFSVVIAGDREMLLPQFSAEARDHHQIHCVKDIPSERPSGGEVLVWDASDIRLDATERGEASSKSGQAAIEYIQAIYRLIKTGIADGIVTGPVSKQSISSPEQPFSGHTEWFAERQGNVQPVMGITCDDWIVTTVTRHVPIHEVPSKLTPERIGSTIETLHEDLKAYFGLEQPRIGVTGLNPHAGEGGKIGSEEIDVIRPVIEEFQAQDMQVEGPVSAETLLTDAGFEPFDAVLVMFHDQAFVPVKSRGLDRCASVTFGLDMVRTSVAHGTGFDLVGTDRFSEKSLCNAIHLARKMVQENMSESESFQQKRN